MTIRAASFWFAMSLGASACSGAQTGENPLLRGHTEAPEAVREGCNIAQRKCTRCHTMDQLLANNASTPEGWRLYVHRMRLMPGASIHAAEEPKIVKCLVYRTFGDEGLATLEGQAP